MVGSVVGSGGVGVPSGGRVGSPVTGGGDTGGVPLVGLGVGRAATGMVVVRRLPGPPGAVGGGIGATKGPGLGGRKAVCSDFSAGVPSRSGRCTRSGKGISECGSAGPPAMLTPTSAV